MPWAPPKRLLLMPLESSILGLRLNSVVDCSVSFNCLDFQSAAPLKVTHSSVVSWSVLHWRTESKVLLQPAGAGLSLVRSLLVPIMGCAVGVGVAIGDASPRQCWIPLDKRSRIPSFPFSNTSANKQLYGGECSSSRVCACTCKGESVSVSKLETLLCGDVDFRSTNEVGVFIIAVGTDLSAVITWAGLGLSAAEPHAL